MRWYGFWALLLMKADPGPPGRRRHGGPPAAVFPARTIEGHTNAYADVHGITIYHVSKASPKDSNYAYYRSTLDFALTTNWDEFLNAYAQ